jgi:hypothetical protein
MAKKSGFFSGRAEVLEAENEMNGTSADPGLDEQILSVGSTTWSPEQAEQYIDWRIQVVDAEISKLRSRLDDLVSVRKRWLAVTGGRSKVAITTGNGSTNGHATNGHATNGHSPA